MTNKELKEKELNKVTGGTSIEEYADPEIVRRRVSSSSNIEVVNTNYNVPGNTDDMEKVWE